MLPAPANAHEDIITIGGARRRYLLSLGREAAHARARTCCLRAVAGSSSQGEDALERLHNLIPGQIVPHDQEGPTVGTGQKLRVIDDALFRVESLWGSHGYLLASVLSTLAQIARRLFAHDNPNSLTACLLRYCAWPHESRALLTK